MPLHRRESAFRVQRLVWSFRLCFAAQKIHKPARFCEGTSSGWGLSKPLQGCFSKTEIAQEVCDSYETESGMPLQMLIGVHGFHEHQVQVAPPTHQPQTPGPPPPQMPKYTNQRAPNPVWLVMNPMWGCNFGCLWSVWPRPTQTGPWKFGWVWRSLNQTCLP